MMEIADKINIRMFHEIDSLVQHYVYSPFGKIVAIKDKNGGDVTDVPLVDNFYTFTGREYDKESGLYYYRARYSDPEVGRFIQSDPHPGKTSVAKSVINKYGYVANNPMRLTDPSGKSWLGNFVKTALVTAAIVAAAYFTGGLAVTYFAATGASAIAIGAVTGALVGGLVGGIGYSALGLGSFKQGFIKGAISGAIAGGMAGYNVTHLSLGDTSQLAYQESSAGVGDVTECDAAMHHLEAMNKIRLGFTIFTGALSFFPGVGPATFIASDVAMQAGVSGAENQEASACLVGN